MSIKDMPVVTVEQIARFREAAIQLEKQNKRLRKSLLEAASEIEEWGQYASPYFQEKHGLQQTIVEFTAIAMEA